MRKRRRSRASHLFARRHSRHRRRRKLSKQKFEASTCKLGSVFVLFSSCKSLRLLTRVELNERRRTSGVQAAHKRRASGTRTAAAFSRIDEQMAAAALVASGVSLLRRRQRSARRRPNGELNATQTSGGARFSPTTSLGYRRRTAHRKFSLSRLCFPAFAPWRAARNKALIWRLYYLNNKTKLMLKINCKSK